LSVRQGHLLQIGSPDLGIERAGYFQDEPLPDYLQGLCAPAYASLTNDSRLRGDAVHLHRLDAAT